VLDRQLLITREFLARSSYVTNTQRQAIAVIQQASSDRFADAARCP
jgi:hypothetical protein